MVDLAKAPESKNFVDHTARTPAQKFLDGLLLKMNPVIAIRKVKEDLLENGYIDAPERTIQLGTPKIPEGPVTMEQLESMLANLKNKK